MLQLGGIKPAPLITTSFDGDSWGDEGTCDQCGETKPVTNTSDPFTSDVNPDEPNEPSDWCEDCYSDRADDI